MAVERRKFLQQVAGFFGGGLLARFGVGRGIAAGAAIAEVAEAAAPPVATAASATWAPGGVRAQVFEVIVRQAQAGAPWKTICLGPMAVNGITIEEVEEEVARRGNEPCNHTDHCACQKCRKRRFEEFKWRSELPCDGTDGCRCETCHRMKMQSLHQEVAAGMKEREDWIERHRKRLV